jgi:hypothetical protein
VTPPEQRIAQPRAGKPLLSLPASPSYAQDLLRDDRHHDDVRRQQFATD